MSDLSISSRTADRLFGDASRAFDELAANLDTLRCSVADALNANASGVCDIVNLQTAHAVIGEIRCDLGALAISYQSLRNALRPPVTDWRLDPDHPMNKAGIPG